MFIDESDPSDRVVEKATGTSPGRAEPSSVHVTEADDLAVARVRSRDCDSTPWRPRSYLPIMHYALYLYYLLLIQ